MTDYCTYVLHHPHHQPYHDQEHGFLIVDEHLLFERLVLEINQAGLSWDLIIKKRATLSQAYAGYDIDKVVQFNEEDFQRLMADKGVIRHRLKIRAIITNAHIIQKMRASHGGFARWLATMHPLPHKEWVKLFKQTFKFTGGEIVNEFLMGIGYLPHAHAVNCPIKKIIHHTPWQDIGEQFYE